MNDRYDRCLRCGDRVTWGQAVCARCNPARLPAPSPTQYHATVFAVVILSLIAVTVWAILRA